MTKELSTTALFLLASAIDKIPNKTLCSRVSNLASAQYLWTRLTDSFQDFTRAYRDFLSKETKTEEETKAINEMGNKMISFSPTENDINFMNKFWDVLIENLSLIGRKELVTLVEAFEIKDQKEEHDCPNQHTM